MLRIFPCKGLYLVKLSIVIGTGAVLAMCYLLEKSYIFAFKSNNISHDGHLLVRYGFMGILTNAIFWSVEFAFHLIFVNYIMRYVGGFNSLAIVLYVDYQLDKKYLFVSDQKKGTL